jgi:hypothetical protein
MKAGMIIGIAGGVVALLLGVVFVFVFGAVGGVAGAVGHSQGVMGSGIGILLSLGLPIMAIVGGALASSNPGPARILLGIPGAAFALLGLIMIADGGALFLVFGALFLLGAFLIHREMGRPGAVS